MERKQERGRKVERKERRRRSSEARKTEPAMTIGVAEETTIASAGDNRACSDGRNQKDECGGSEGTGTGAEYGDSSKTRSFCNGGR